MNGKKVRALRRAIGAVSANKELLNGFNALCFNAGRLRNEEGRILGAVAAAYKNLKKAYYPMAHNPALRAGFHVTLGNLSNTGVFKNAGNADALRTQSELLLRMCAAHISVRNMPVGGRNGRTASK